VLNTVDDFYALAQID